MLRIAAHLRIGLVVALASIVAVAASAGPMPRAAVDYTLSLGEQRFDPLRHMVTLDAGWDQISNAGTDLRLVQFSGPIQESWLSSLRDEGLEPIQYIHPYTYIVWGDRDSRSSSSRLPGVRWTGDFVNGFRVLPRWRNLSNAPLESRLLLYRGADTERALDLLADRGATRMDRRILDERFEIVSFNAPGSAYQSLSGVPGVYALQPRPLDGGLRSEMSSQVNAGNVDNGNNAFPGYRQWLLDMGINGNGVAIAIVDGGSDQNHTDLAGQFGSCTGESCGGSASSSHGTHTAGIVAATGASGVTDSWGFLRGLGVAPGATLVEQVYSPVYQQPGGMLQLMTESQQSGAIASSNSWGPSGSPQGYDIDTMEVDIGVRDADSGVSGDQPLSYVLAIMNGNGGTSSQGSPDEAKNIFTIGSTKMRGSSGSQDTNIDDISSNSAHGPCLDGRKIPHMVAPGCNVDSSVPGGHSLMCGTSMACPQVAGAVALFAEHYRNETGDDPSPAMVKAALTAAARDLAGNDDADGNTLGHPFDSKQGWGRLDLPAVLLNDPGSVRYFDAPAILDATGDQWTLTVSPHDPSQPIRIMLAWTDAPGHGLGGSTPAWNNDLDLVVQGGLSTWRGNNIGSDGWSSTGGSADDRNNTEGVFLGPVPPGQVTIVVQAANLTSDGVPNSGDGIDQDFSLVCYNCAEDPGFSMAVDPASASLCAPGEVEYTVSVGQILGYEELVVLSLDNLPDGLVGMFSANPVVPPAEVTLTVSTGVQAPSGSHDFEVIGISIDQMHTAGANIGVSEDAPEVVTLVRPLDGAMDEDLAPLFEWAAVSGDATYHLQVSATADTSQIVYEENGIVDSSLDLPILLDSATTYYWRVSASNWCGDGEWAAWRSFTTTDAIRILLVDDDDNSPDVRSMFEGPLDDIGVVYDIWDTNNSDNEPDAATLNGYPLVVWFTGDEFGGSAGPGSAGEAALATYIAAGGHLLLSSQDYLWDRGLTDFGEQWLGIGSYDNDEGHDSVTGEGDLFGEFGSVGLSYPFSNWSDIVSPGGGASLTFSGSEGNAAILRDDPDGGGAIFLGFPLVAVAESRRAEILEIVLAWGGGGGDPCPADCNGDGLVDVMDLLAIIAAWGESGACDVTGDGIIGVEDLLAVIAAWGGC